MGWCTCTCPLLGVKRTFVSADDNAAKLGRTLPLHHEGDPRVQVNVKAKRIW